MHPPMAEATLASPEDNSSGNTPVLHNSKIKIFNRDNNIRLMELYTHSKM